MKLKQHLMMMFLLISGVGYSQGDWKRMADLPGPERHHPVTFSIDGQGYLLTGMTSSFSVLSDFYRYDPVANSWTKLTNFPGGARAFAYGGSFNGKGYIGFGLGQSGRLNDLWEYDPTTDTWKQLATCSCSARRHPAFLITANGKLFVGMGDDSAGDRNDWWEYSIASNTWTQRSNLPGPNRHHPYYFGVGNFAYVGFGHSGNNIYKDFYRYNSVDNSWTKMKDFPAEGRVAGTQFDHGDFGYILSGEGEDHQNLDTGEFYQYDPSKDEWTVQQPHPGDGRWATGTFVIDKKVYVVAGEDADGITLKSMWSYDLGLIVGSNPVIASIEDGFKQGYISIYPNPAQDWLTIDMGTNTISEVQILSLDGREVMSVEPELGSENIQIAVSDLKEGIYLLQVSAQGEVLRRKIVKR